MCLEVTRHRPAEHEIEIEAHALRALWDRLEIPGVIDVHTHFMPPSVLDKVWAYFDRVGPFLGRDWPITYRFPEPDRLLLLHRFGVLAFPALVYAHKPDMAAWLNEWALDFARRTDRCLPTATFHAEPDAAAYVADALDHEVAIFKCHVQVGDFDPNDPLLEPVWALLEESGTPIVIHAGSGPAPGRFTGPARIASLLRTHPRLRLIIAHMGMPEYGEFLDLAEQHAGVHLDTTMAFTPFIETDHPFPADQRPRLLELGDRILFGSDFPNIPYRYLDAVHAVIDLDLGDDWLRGGVPSQRRTSRVGISRRQAGSRRHFGRVHEPCVRLSHRRASTRYRSGAAAPLRRGTSHFPTDARSVLLVIASFRSGPRWQNNGMVPSEDPIHDEPDTDDPPRQRSGDPHDRDGDTRDEAADESSRPGTTPMPDADEAPRADDLLPDDPSPDAAMTGDPAKKTAIEAPVPAHGGIASAEQLAEGERAEELAEHRDDPPARN